MINLALIDGNDYHRRTLEPVIINDGSFKLLFSVSDFKLPRNDREVPEIILLDVVLPSGNGLELLHKLRQRYPEAKVIIYSTINDPHITRLAFHRGVDGFLLKESDFIYLKYSLMMALDGGKPISPILSNHILESGKEKLSVKELYPNLTTKELSIVTYVRAGVPTKVLSYMLNVSYNTVNFHMKNIYRKLHINSKTELLLLIGNTGLN